MAQHIVASFEAEMQRLSALIVDMGAMAGGQIEAANAALRTLDTEMANKIVAADKRIDDLAKNNAKRVLEMRTQGRPAHIGANLDVLAGRVVQQLSDVLRPSLAATST
jgi:phosphate transport system protein